MILDDDHHIKEDILNIPLSSDILHQLGWHPSIGDFISIQYRHSAFEFLFEGRKDLKDAACLEYFSASKTYRLRTRKNCVLNSVRVWYASDLLIQMKNLLGYDPGR